MTMKAVIEDITGRIADRSGARRRAYLDQLQRRRGQGPRRGALSCGNLAHTIAACSAAEKNQLAGDQAPNIGIVTAYNDMLSAHQPYRDVPELLKRELLAHGATGQVAGGVPAMCDGVTQGRAGMELSLFSRDVIAMATAVALSHDAFDGMLLLGICDKIVPGLLIGALRFGHLPALFVPSGPMPSGLPNPEKAKVRQAYAEGKADRDELLAAESASYHSAGTCTFYGTANSNQLLMELMGLHLPGASFVPPGTELRDALHGAAAARIAALAADVGGRHALGRMIDERAMVNALVGLLATGGSTNHTLHLPAIAAAAGITLTWDDMDELSRQVPLLTRIYPNGTADINHFHQAGGMGFLVAQLLDAGLLHEDVLTVFDSGLGAYRAAPALTDSGLDWQPVAAVSGDNTVLRAAAEPFAADGGLRLLQGNLGRSVIKVSAVAPEHRVVEAPARVFTDQDQLRAAFEAGELDRDLVAVVRFQGPCSNGMPELHKLTPYLGVLQDRGFRVALVTDGRMSGASGKVPAAIHLTPEAADGGMIARIRDGDMLRLDAGRGELQLLVNAAELEQRQAVQQPSRLADCGQDLFGVFRQSVGVAAAGASVFQFDEETV
jgi:phosphogluconate dehydratase